MTDAPRPSERPDEPDAIGAAPTRAARSRASRRAARGRNRQSARGVLRLLRSRFALRVALLLLVVVALALVPALLSSVR